jgi:hypothetical protein
MPMRIVSPACDAPEAVEEALVPDCDVELDVHPANSATLSANAESLETMPRKRMYNLLLSALRYAEGGGIPFAYALFVTRWTYITLALATAFYALALSHEVYDVTSPQGLTWHVLLRKAYSVVAFSLIAVCVRADLFARGARARPAFLWCVILLAAYSAAIEIGQALDGSREGLEWNVVDVACGALGGALGAIAFRQRR